MALSRRIPLHRRSHFGEGCTDVAVCAARTKPHTSACRKADPSAWLEARSHFTRTTASWSLAGHMVGLGDRHCDNLLIDEISGANVQIDFGHLFDSARDLPIPEVVPFRLTQNIVDSFGVTGVEGSFRASCCAGARSRRALLALPCPPPN